MRGGLKAMTTFFGFALAVGDSVVVMGVRGLPRLTDRHEYSEEEVAQATFEFHEYTVE